jgi:uncharacterized protein YyaL (SSP411 family)
MAQQSVLDEPVVSRRGLGVNRLAGATSPYLLQHKDNPVDWWPWGDEAFAEARRRDVPVFLSVGYAACHWCQVTQKRGKMASLQVSGL